MPNERRRLTHDEIKAAEAAFQGRAFKESWSQAARAVYDGILVASRKLKPSPEVFGGPLADSGPAETEELVSLLQHTGQNETRIRE